MPPSLRNLLKAPGFTIAVVTTLALGIGANSAMFSVVDRLLFRAPPMMKSPELTHRVYLVRDFRGKPFFGDGVQFARYLDLTNWTTSFARTAEVSSRKLPIGVGTDAAEMQVGVVSASFFGFFDAPPVLGRYFTPDEDKPPAGTPVAVLSYGLWQTRYGGAADVLGKPVQIGATIHTIIGVAPRGFVGIWADQPPAAFIPISVNAAEIGGSLRLHGETWWTSYHWTFARMLVQRKPGVTLERANADLTAAYLKSWAADKATSPNLEPESVAKPHAIAASILAERGPNESSEAKVATWVAGVAVIVWLIACANVANLLLARAIKRRREIAVRLALGVSRARLARQLLGESLLLGGLGGLAGVLVAQWGGALLRAEFMPKGAEAAVMTDSRTLVFAAVAALAAGLLTGLAPILQSRRADLTLDLKAGAREGVVHRSRLRSGLLVFQGALSVLLLVGAGLFVRSLHNVSTMRLGYDADRVMVVDLRMRGVQLDSAHEVTLRHQLIEEAHRIPGIQYAALGVTMPFWMTWSTGLFVAGIDSVEKLGEFDLNAVSPDYFAAMGTRILRGRGITDADVEGAPRAIVVSEAMAKTLWPGKEALGQCIKVDADTLPCSYVVGIAENIKSQSLSDDPGLFYYLSHAQYATQQGGLFLRTPAGGAVTAESVRRKLQALMPGASYVTVTPLSDVIGGETASWRLGATMFTLFGVLALVLAAIGLYSVIAYNVAQRTHELGVRVALGAQMRDLVRMVLRDGMRVVVIGIVIGAGIAIGVSRWVKPLLFQQSALDPVVYVGVAATLLSVAALACWIPARRAGTVDPMTALSAE